MAQPPSGPPKLSFYDGMHLPPFFPLLDKPEERLQAIKDMNTRDDDVFLVAYPKSGTHWTYEITKMLLNGKADYQKETKEEAFLEAIIDLNTVEDLESPRVLNTHLPHRWLPTKHLKNGGKIVHVMRNPKDVLVSSYFHVSSQAKDPMPWPAYFDLLIRGAIKVMGGWTAYEKEFEKAKETADKEVIHTIKYEELKKNPIDEIKRLAKYLGVECDDQLVEDIADKCSFQKLKIADETLKSKENFKTIIGKMDGSQNKIPSIYRKGQVGDWKNHFTVAQNEQYDAYLKEEMKDSKLNFTYVL